MTSKNRNIKIWCMPSFWYR